MTFTVEDGTGVTAANAYISLAYARAYHDERGQLSTWNGASLTTPITGATHADDTVTVVDHPFKTGDGPVRLTGATLPTGLAAATDYWIVVATSSTVKFATSYASALAGTVVNLTANGSGSMAIVHPSFDAQRQAIVKATDHLEQEYGGRFLGVKGSETQGLHWPADGAWLAGVELAGVPEALRRACAEYALRALSASLAPDQDSGGALTMLSVSADGMTTTKQYAAGTVAAGGGSPEYPSADRWLSSLLGQPMAVRF